jgi:competence ComEA-like helix-hairpin-helix protein
MNFKFTTIANLFSMLLAIVLCFVSASCSSAYRNERVVIANQASTENKVNLNTASASELEQLPNIGETLAKRIVDYRENNGRFRRPEHLLLVEGISEKRFREIRPFIKTE